jgi:predicted O-linked N-acetylglucosamine transferase (SPINDLY family)
VNYFGFPGTMGVPYIDYIIADKIVIPEDAQHHYSEKIVYLPDSYQPNDRSRSIGTRAYTRAECGLPAEELVFSSFNASYKILPEVFAVWMRLLAHVPQSVLWLLEGNSAVKGNLQREAEHRGISPDRLIFAPAMNLANHIARSRLADLFLDTLPCDAHTTASDALWAGVPVVTCMGSTFAGRVAASLLNAIGLPELISSSLEEYEALALKLAQDPALLAAVKAKLAEHRETFPLFDIVRYARHLEAAYTEMVARNHRGDPPVSFSVAPALLGRHA